MTDKYSALVNKFKVVSNGKPVHSDSRGQDANRMQTGKRTMKVGVNSDSMLYVDHGLGSCHLSQDGRVHRTNDQSCWLAKACEIVLLLLETRRVEGQQLCRLVSKKCRRCR